MILKYYETPIYYEINGEGPAVVLLHGFLESSAMWERIIPVLSQNKTVISIDLPGFGKSGIIETVHSMELMANVVNHVVKHHSFKDISIIGHSMGGYVAMAYCENYPDSIANLVLLNSTPACDSLERKINRARALKIMDKNAAVFLTMAIQNLFVEGSRKKYALEIEKMKIEVLNLSLEGIKAAISGMKNRKDRTPVLKKFSGNKLMICGINDPIIPISVSTAIAKNTSTPIIKLNGGHLGVLENFNEIIQIVTLSDI